MRHLIMLVISLLLVVTVTSGIKPADDPASGNSLSVFCSPDLEGLVSRWAGEFLKQNPGQNVKVVILTDDLRENFNPGKSLGFISSRYPDFYNEKMWNTVVGRDVAVFVFNTENPLKEEISTTGISLSKLTEALETSESRNWGLLLKSGGNNPLNIYVVDDLSISACVSELSPEGKAIPGSIKVENTAELVKLLQNDKYSIGICKMSDIMDPVSNSVAGINLLPVDRNENGSMDYMERIYDNPVNLSRGVWMGKYPSSLFSNIYSVSSSQPVNKTEKAFLIWCLTEGQLYLHQYGFSELLRGERDNRLEMLTNNDSNLVNAATGIKASTVLLIVLGLLSLSFIISLAVKNAGKKRTVTGEASMIRTRIFDVDSLDIMPGLYYDKSHTWAFMEKDGMVRIGLDDFIQHVTGHVTKVKMKNAGETVIKGKPVFSIIQDGKKLNLYSPVSGTIKEFNGQLNSRTSVINTSPYDQGWIYRIEPSRWFNEIGFLMIGKKYREWIKEELSRLKEFLSSAPKNQSGEFSSVLQDGGEIRDRILEDAGPEIWEDFQTHFLDMAR